MNNAVSAAELNINIWPFSRSRSAARGGGGSESEQRAVLEEQLGGGDGRIGCTWEGAAPRGAGKGGEKRWELLWSDESWGLEGESVEFECAYVYWLPESFELWVW